MKLLQIGGGHHKNQIGLDMICNHLKIEKTSSHNYREGFDIIYSSQKPLDKKAIYGPGMGTFPNDNAKKLTKGIYIQPSEWASRVWHTDFNYKNVPVVPFPFPVDTEKFKPIDCEKQKVFVYFKHRTSRDLKTVLLFLKSKKIDYILIKYRHYKEENYLNILQSSKYGIWVGGHESQGFALEEALSCNVPLLVWSVTSMKQECAGFKYDDYKATTIPYWDERCGEYFYEKEELDSKFDTFISKLDSYKPRDYIMENLSVEKCSERFLDLINKYDLKN